MRKWIPATGAISLATVLLVVGTGSVAHALAGPHTYTDGTTGDVFLGGDYIELGISKLGSFGTTSGKPLPSGFFGTAARTNVGMSTNPTGFGVAPDLRMDYFLPGSPEERWVVGYKQSGTPATGSNSLLRGASSISDNTVTDQSSGNQLKATGEGTFNSKLKTTQVISFERGDKFFKNEVTLTNVGGSALDSVRYMRSFDPDNTVDQGGAYDTHITIPYTQAGGDGKAVVIADTNVSGNTDPVHTANGSYSPILFYSSDAHARVSSFGFSNADPYAASAYDSAEAKGFAADADQAITITFDVGTLAPGASQTVVYYTSLDNRDFSAVLADIQTSEGAPADDGDNVSTTVEDNGPNNGDANGDGTKDSLQSGVTSLPNTVVGGGTYQALQVTGDCGTLTQAAVKSESQLGTDGSYSYPLGLTDYTATCTTAGGTANVKIYYDKQYNTSGWKVRKFVHGRFVDVPGAVLGAATVGSKTVTTLSYTVTDGGSLDADGTANGTVVDPAGPAVLAATAPNTGLPHKNQLALLSPLFIGAGVVMVAAGIKARRLDRAGKRT